jgi:hypothetical protein
MRRSSLAGLCLVAALAVMATACALVVGLKDRELAAAEDGGPGDALAGDAPEDTTTEASPDVTSDARAADGGDAAHTTDASDAGPDGSDRGCVADLDADTMNCGRCGHDCLGGACLAGSCQPVTIGTTTLDVLALAVDSTDVYWGTLSTIEKCPISGCGAGVATLTSGRPNYPNSVAVYGSTVYWAEPSTAGPDSVSVTGTSVGTIDNAVNPYQVVIDPSHAVLYWTDDAANTGLRYCTLPTCASPNTLGIGFTSGTTTAAVNGNAVYIGNANTSSLYSCSFGNCSNPTDMNARVVVAQLAADSKTVYIADDQTSGHIWTCPVSGCSDAGATALTGTETFPSALGVDSANLYWTDKGNAIRWCALPGCASPQTLAPGNVHGMAIDARAVYFGAGQSVKRVAKP